MSAVTAFIMQEAPIGASIAIMRYHNVADRLIDGFVRIQSDEDRHTLVSVLPTHPFGLTSVGDALYKATVVRLGSFRLVPFIIRKTGTCFS